jgi:hypothetical protein
VQGNQAAAVMALATLSTFPTDPLQAGSWSFQHMVNHRDIIRRIQEQGGPALSEYALDPITPDNMEQWNLLHYEMHRQMNGVFGVVGANLGDVDWSDKESVAWFITQNFSDHERLSAALQIG